MSMLMRCEMSSISYLLIKFLVFLLLLLLFFFFFHKRSKCICLPLMEIKGDECLYHLLLL